MDYDFIRDLVEGIYFTQADKSASKAEDIIMKWIDVEYYLDRISEKVPENRWLRGPFLTDLSTAYFSLTIRLR